MLEEFRLPEDFDASQVTVFNTNTFLASARALATVQVDYFQPCDDGTLMVFSDGQKLELQESYDAVAEVMNPERQAGC